MLVPNASKEQTKRFHRGYIGGSRVSAGRPSLYEIVALSYIPQTVKFFQRNEFHLVTAKVFALESFAVYGILCTYILVLYLSCIKRLFMDLLLFHFRTKDSDMHAYADS